MTRNSNKSCRRKPRKDSSCETDTPQINAGSALTGELAISNIKYRQTFDFSNICDQPSIDLVARDGLSSENVAADSEAADSSEDLIFLRSPFIYNNDQATISIPSDVLLNEYEETPHRSFEHVSSEILSLLYGIDSDHVRSRIQDGFTGRKGTEEYNEGEEDGETESGEEDDNIDASDKSSSSSSSSSSPSSSSSSINLPLEPLYKVPWLTPGKHAIVVPPTAHSLSYIHTDLSKDGDHEDHSLAMELSEDIPLKKCRLPRFAIHQTISTLTLVFFVQNVDRRSISITLCNCNSLLRIAFCLRGTHHTSYRVVIGVPGIDQALTFPQSIVCDLVRDTMLVIYLHKSPAHHSIWREITAGAAGSQQLKKYALFGDDIPTKICDSFSPYNNQGSMELQRRFSVPCQRSCSFDGSGDAISFTDSHDTEQGCCRGILKNSRLCARTLSECSENLEFSSWDISESLKNSLHHLSTSLTDASSCPKKSVHFNNKVIETMYKPGTLAIGKRRNRLQRTRSLSESSEFSSEENSDSALVDDLNRQVDLFHLEIEDPLTVESH